MNVSDEWFPMRDPRAGGTIYIWQLGRNRTAHTVRATSEPFACSCKRANRAA